jgi:hypothetical protein
MAGEVLDDARLVVHGHDGDEEGRGLQRLAQHVEVEEAVRAHRQDDGLEALGAQVAHGFEHAFVLGRERDDAARALLAGEAGGALDGDVVGFRGAGGEDHLARLGADQLGDLAARRPTASSAARPSACSTECGLAKFSSHHGRMAARTRGSIGVVAWWSR